MYIVAPHIEKSSTPEYTAGEKVQKNKESFSSIFSGVVENDSASADKIEKKNKEKIEVKQIEDKIKSMDLSEVSGLTKEEKKALFAKIEKLLQSLKEGKDTKEIFAAWTKGEIELVIPLGMKNGKNAESTVLLQILSTGKSESGKGFSLSLSGFDSAAKTKSGEGFNLSLSGFESDGKSEKINNLLKQFVKAEKSEKTEIIALMKNSSAKLNSETANANQKTAQVNTANTHLVNIDNEKINLVVINQRQLSQNQQGFGKHLAALLASVDGKLKVNSNTAKSAGNGNEKNVETLADFKNQVHHEAKQKKVQVKSRDVQIQLNEQSQKPQVGIKISESAGGEKNFVSSLQNMVGQSSTMRGFGQAGPVSAQSVIAQVVQKIESMVQTARIQQNSMQSNVLNANLALKPQSLGSVMMNLRFQQDTLSGVISAATKEAKAIIEANLPAIKEALQQQNTIVQNIEVEVRPDLEQEHQSAFAEQFSDRKENDSDDTSTENIFGLHLNNEQPAIEIIDPLQSKVNPNGDLAYYA